jgi:hypothetical protein
MVMLSHEIAKVGVNFYFEEMADWYREIEYILSKHNCKPEPMPEIHTDKGSAFVEFNGKYEGQIYFTWYKMPTGRWEVVSYRS